MCDLQAQKPIFSSSINIGHFHLANQFEKRNLVKEILTGFPRFKLKFEQGILSGKIHTFPCLQAPYIGRDRIGIKFSARLVSNWAGLSHTLLDSYASKRIEPGSTLLALSGSGLKSGRVSLREEYALWELPYHGIAPRKVAREEGEHELENYVSVPSTFVADSVVAMVFSRDRLFLNLFGARLERFYPVAKPTPNAFTVIYVGNVFLRKGFLYLLAAFNRLRHPKQQLRIVGHISEEIKSLLGNRSGVSGYDTKCRAPYLYSTGMLSIDGFIFPPSSADRLAEQLEMLIDNRDLQQTISEAALTHVKSLSGWDTYCERCAQELSEGMYR